MMTKTLDRALPLVAAALLAVPAAAQAPKTDVPDRFYVEAGGFNIAADSKLTLGSARLGSSTIDFETDLDLPERATTVFVDGYWRMTRRQLLSLSFASVAREGTGHTLNRDITWGGVTYPVGLQTNGRVDSDYLSGAYRFAIYRNDDFEIGPALGFGYLWVKAALDVTGANVGQFVDREATNGSVTGNVGGYLRWWPGRRFLVRADGRYIVIKPENAEAALTDLQAGLTYYPWQHFGVGAHYAYSKFRYDRGLLSSELGGTYRYGGIQVLLSYAP